MTSVADAGKTGWCKQHRQPREQCEPWDRHGHTVRWRDDDFETTADGAAAARMLVSAFVTGAATAFAGGYIRCDRGTTCATAGPPVPVMFGDLTGKPPAEWLGEAARTVRRQHPRHEPVWIGAPPPAGKPAAAAEKPPQAIVEPPAPVPAPRRETGPRPEEEAAPVAADGELAATVATLQARIEEMEAAENTRRTAVTALPAVSGGTAVFLEPGGEPVPSFPVPDVPARTKKGRTATAKCDHHVPRGTRCKICQPGRQT